MMRYIGPMAAARLDAMIMLFRDDATFGNRLAPDKPLVGHKSVL